MDFDYPTATGSSPEWYRVEGGTSQVIQTMVARLSHRPLLEHRVKSIIQEPKNCDYPMSVHVDGEDEPRQYSAVFSTAPLPCLRRMQLGPGILSAQQRAAVQSVHYDDSTKIAVRFRTAWWRTICGIKGGQATTDLPIRTCVYPSDGSTVLLCSYTWGQDAHQMGSLLNCDSKSARRHLKQLVLDNLALLHQGCLDRSTGMARGYERMRQLLDQEFEDIHGHHWGGDPDSAGAFAYFGPGQFRAFYPALVQPAADGRMFLVGEACSAHHGWIAGSLESSYRAIRQYLSLLQSSGQVDPGRLDQLQQSWGLQKIRPVQS
jgi:monoamine oxidase